MEFMYGLWAAFLACLFAVIVGFGISTRKTSIGWIHLVALFALTFCISLSGAFFGKWMGQFLSPRALEMMVGLTMIVLGVLIAISPPAYPGFRDMLLFIGALQANVMLLGYTYGAENEAGYGFPVMMSLLFVICLLGGILLGQKRWRDWRIKTALPYISPACIVLIGIMNLF
jgi:hypothetical protein